MVATRGGSSGRAAPGAASVGSPRATTVRVNAIPRDRLPLGQDAQAVLVDLENGRKAVVRQRNTLPFESNVHLHGGYVPAAHDGHPMDVIAAGRSFGGRCTSATGCGYACRC